MSADLSRLTGLDYAIWQLLSGTMVTRRHTDPGRQENRTQLLNASATPAADSGIQSVTKVFASFARRAPVARCLHI